MQKSPYDTVLSANDVTIPTGAEDLPPLTEDWNLESGASIAYGYRAYPHLYHPYHLVYRHNGKPGDTRQGEHQYNQGLKHLPDAADGMDRPLRLIHVGP